MLGRALAPGRRPAARRRANVPRSWRAPFMRHHASSGSGRVRTRCRRSSHSSSRPFEAAHRLRAARRARRAARAGTRRRPRRTPSAPHVSGRRVQSVRRSPLPRRHAEQPLDERRERRRSEPDESGRDLRVEQLRRDRARTAGRGSRGPVRPRGRPSRPALRGSRRGGSTSTASGSISAMPCRPRDLHQREPGPVACARRGTRCRARTAARRGARRSRSASAASSSTQRGSTPHIYAGCTACPHCRRGVRSDASTSPWSSARWRTITSVQPISPRSANAAATRSTPPTTGAAGSKPR